MSLTESKVLDLLHSSSLGSALVRDPVAFMRSHPDTVLIHQSRDPRIPHQRRLELQREVVGDSSFVRRKRFALRLPEPSTGGLCIKLRPQARLTRFFGPHHARNEHTRHLSVQSLGFAATRPIGFAQLSDSRGGMWQYFLQEVLEETDLSGESLSELAPDERMPRVAQELATLHRADIFHGDLKPYHVVLRPNSPHWLYIDLDPVRFGLTRRRRAINLYQVLRYFLGADESLAEPLVQHYVREIPDFPSVKQAALLSALRQIFKHKMENHRGPELRT